MEGMKTLDIRSYRETIKAAVAHERQADPNWSWGIRSILMDTFLRCMAHARRDGGLYCDGVASKEA